jgi:hypothetical protein
VMWLEIALSVGSIALYAIVDFYVKGCERI